MRLVSRLAIHIAPRAGFHRSRIKCVVPSGLSPARSHLTLVRATRTVGIVTGRVNPGFRKGHSRVGVGVGVAILLPSQNPYPSRGYYGYRLVCVSSPLCELLREIDHFHPLDAVLSLHQCSLASSLLHTLPHPHPLSHLFPQVPSRSPQARLPTSHGLPTFAGHRRRSAPP